MRTNIITAIAGDKPYIKTDSVFQYDYGLKLVLDGITLPEEYDVHFSNTNKPSAKTVKGDSSGVSIPDEYLLNGEDVHAWLYLHAVDKDSDGESIYHIHIPVVSRPAIAEEQITPVQHNVIEEALEQMEEAVEETHENVMHYPYINEEYYWMVYNAETSQFVNTGVKANGERFDMGIGDVSTLPAGTPATASLTWEGQNAFLNLGLPAGDASGMVSVHRECVNGNPITITDGANGILLDEMQITVKPMIEGTGTPSPSNIRRITGVTNITITHNSESRLVDFGDNVGTIYGGTYYPLTGRLIVDRVYITKNCSGMDNTEVQPGWNNSGIKDIVGDNVSTVYTNQTMNVGTSFGVDTTNGNDLLYLGYDQYHMRQQDWVNSEITVQICVPIPTPIEYHINPISIETAFGNNTYSVDHGTIAYMKYPCDTKLFVEYVIEHSGYYTKPANGIPRSDLASAVVSEISGKIDSNTKGVANGVAELDQSGKIPSSQLPSYVDDILEYDSTSSFPQYGESGKIYVADNTNKTYRWGGNGYVEISASLALGETSGSAYRGDHGKIAYDHATDSGRLTTAQVEGLYKIAVTSEGHIASVSAVQASDLAALGFIDDTAGSGDTGKTWSANKIAAENSALLTEINSRPESVGTDASGVDLDIVDSDGYVLARFKDGHFQTKNFDSEDMEKASATVFTDAEHSGLDVIDANGNVVLRLLNGDIQTKNFDSKEAINPVEYKFSGDDLLIGYGYNSTHDAVVVMNEGRANDLFDFSDLKLKPKGMPLSELETADLTSVWHSGTDMHGPFEFLAVNNADGVKSDSTDPGWTGGVHTVDNSGQQLKSAETAYVHVFADGVPVSSGHGRCNNLEIRWANNVQAYNTVKADGTGRVCLVEYHDMVFDGIRFNEKVKFTPTEDIKMQLWYGFQGVAFGSVYENVEFVDAANRETFTTIDSNTVSGNSVTSGIRGYGDDHAVEILVDINTDLGKRDYYTGTEGAFAVASTGKVYFNIIRKFGASQVEMDEDTNYYLNGSYRFYPVVQ